MKKKLSILCFAVTFFIIQSCNHSNEILNEITKEETTIFQGEIVRLQKGVVKEDFDDYLYKINSDITIVANNLRTSEIDYSGISLEDIYQIIGRLIKQYPDLKKEEFSDEDMATIQKDIPSIRNKEDSKTKKSVIFDYYNVLISKELKRELEKKKKGGRGSATTDYGGTDFEKALANNDPLAGYYFGNVAKSEAENATNEVFGKYLPDDEKVNAFKHAVWNAIGIQEVVQRSGNKWTSLDRIKKLACAHEYEYSAGIWQLPNNMQVAMDLHNNLMGRTYMYHNVNTGWFGIVTYVPSDGRIRDDIKNYVFSKIYSVNDVLSLSSSYNWYNLGHFVNAMNYHTDPGNKLVYILD